MINNMTTIGIQLINTSRIIKIESKKIKATMCTLFFYYY